MYDIISIITINVCKISIKCPSAVSDIFSSFSAYSRDRDILPVEAQDEGAQAEKKSEEAKIFL